MAWEVVYHPRAVKELKRFTAKDQGRVIAKIEKLAKNPSDSSLDLKPLVGTRQSFRLRVGRLRAIFEKEAKAKTIYIWKVSHRGSVY